MDRQQAWTPFPAAAHGLGVLGKEPRPRTAEFIMTSKTGHGQESGLLARAPAAGSMAVVTVTGWDSARWRIIVDAASPSRTDRAASAAATATPAQTRSPRWNA